MKKKAQKVNQDAISGPKRDVIIAVLKAMEEKPVIYNEQAIAALRGYAAFYRIPLRNKLVNLTLVQSLRKFIINDGGYNTTIVDLYNALLNAKKQTSD